MSEKKAIQESILNAEDDAELAIYEEELEAITKAVDEAQDALLSKTEEWAEAMKAVLENTIAAAGKELEDAFNKLDEAWGELNEAEGQLNAAQATLEDAKEKLREKEKEALKQLEEAEALLKNKINANYVDFLEKKLY